jgi:O-antigen ligase/tetratricopeptide (TPR) repeat protein
MSASPPTQPPVVKFLSAAQEAVVLVLVGFAPWPFGSVHPLFEFVLLAGVAVLLVLWGLSILAAWQFTWKRCPVALCLAGLVLLGVVQLIPLPADLLGWLSPSAAQLRADLRPATHEQLISGELPGPPPPAPAAASGSTLSLYPDGTRLAVLRLLAVFLLFAAVRNNYASKESLRRLALVCFVNGAALALFALVQFFTTQRHVIFWFYETGGTVFGPFINRNHFAFFVNVCLCLTGGLLAGYWLNGRRREGGWGDVLQHPPSLWLGIFGALMLVSLAFCLSRGGLAALSVGCLAAVAVRWAGLPKRSWRGPAVAASALLVFGLVVWYVLPRAESRLATLRHTNVQEARLSVWANALVIGRDFPLAGSGYGTFRFMELSRRPSAWTPPGGDDPRLVYSYAHNDYVEAWAEGGAGRLLLSLAAVAVMFVLSLRAYRRYRGHPAGAWTLGALAAFTTVAVHSFFEFGLHVPAIVLLATVLAAHLAALGARRTPDNRQEEYDLSLFGVGPPLAAVALVLLAGTLVSEGWRRAQAERFRLAAEYRDLNRREESHAPQVEYLTAAVRYSPDDAALRQALAEAHLWQAEHTSEPGHRAAAARQLLAARDLCPVMVQPQLKLAALTNEFSSPDSAGDYLARAARLGPTDPEIWYLRGCVEQPADEETAWGYWRRSLQLSDHYLPDILQKLGPKPDPAAVAEKLLPDDPHMLWNTEEQLYSHDRAAGDVLLRRALELLQARKEKDAKGFYLQGQIQRKFSEFGAAIGSYREALKRDPSQTQWRYELASLLNQEQAFQEAEHEVERVLRENPYHADAKALLRALQQRDEP